MSGEINEQGVLFEINLDAHSNLFHGVAISQIKIRTDLEKILTDTGKDLISDETKSIFIKYVLDKIPFVSEVNLAKDMLATLASNILDTSNINNIMKNIATHRDRVLELNIPFREYYINHYLVGEFQGFFQANNMNFVVGDLSKLFDRLYSNYIQSINVLLPPELEHEINQNRARISQDLDTYTFLLVANNLFETDKIKTKLLSIGFSNN